MFIKIKIEKFMVKKIKTKHGTFKAEIHLDHLSGEFIAWWINYLDIKVEGKDIEEAISMLEEKLNEKFQ